MSRKILTYFVISLYVGTALNSVQATNRFPEISYTQLSPIQLQQFRNLDAAISFGQINRVTDILNRYPALVNVTSIFGETPLTIAADAEYTLNTPLIIETLLIRGANINHVTASNMSSLFKLIRKGRTHTSSILTLLDHGANVRIDRHYALRDAIIYGCSGEVVGRLMNLTRDITGREMVSEIVTNAMYVVRGYKSKRNKGINKRLKH